MAAFCVAAFRKAEVFEVALPDSASIGYSACMSESIAILVCPPARRPDALRILHESLPAAQQSDLVHALEAAGYQDDSAYAGLLVAMRAEEILTAAWIQVTAGQTAVVWIPAAAECPVAVELLPAVPRFLDEHGVSLAQFLVSDESVIDSEFITKAEFKKLAKLAYLTADQRLFPSSLPKSELTFQSRASDDANRLGELLLRTYEESQDCPDLNGIRTSEEVLTGYREQGTFAPERWFFVQHNNRDIGALIMTEHTDSGNWELVYMGLVPAARGAGWGRQVLEYALWQAGLCGAARLVLAVDEANQPALDMYADAGLVAWDYRTVYARLRPKK